MPTDAEVFSGGALTDDQVFGGKDNAVPDTPWDRAMSVLKDTGLRMVKAGAAAADMVVGVPGQAIGLSANIGARAYAAGAGEDRKTVEEAGATAQEHVPRMIERFFKMAPKGLTEPIQTIVNTIAGGESYDQEIVGKAVEKVAQGVDKATRGYVSAEDAKLLIDSAMLAGGAKGGDVMAKAALDKAPKAGGKARESYTDAEVFAEPEAKGPDFSSIPEPVEVTPKVLKQIFEKAKDPRNAVDNLFAAAKAGRLPVKPLDESLPPSSEPKGRLPNEGVIIGDAGQSGWRKLVNGEAPDLTAEERIALQDVVKPRQLVDAEGKPLNRQAGFSDPSHLAKIAAITGISAAGIMYMNKEHPEVMKAFRNKVRDLLGMEDEDAKARDADTERQYRNNLEQQKYEERLRNGYEPPIMHSVDGNPLADGTDILGPLAVGMAVKGKGGMWHPEAVARLARPLGINAISDATRRGPEGRRPESEAPEYKWAQTAVARYLNKHAGTDSDPLKDIQIPFGEETKRWENLWEDAVTHKAAVNHPEIKGAKPEEAIWNIADSAWQEGSNPKGAEARQAITSFLAHAGDFAKQNIAPDKLGQYDLPRLIKETAKNDERVAKEMEKAAGDMTKQLPVYKDYGDGMKWVELKLPEKLTEEQAKSVQEVTLERLKKQVGNNEVWRETIKDFREENGGRDPTVSEMHDQLADYGTPFYRYEAIDPKTGKQVTNSYTEEPARGATPEEAWLAGRLAEEGNALGHCVGGYCDAVASGESKIYSLRDAKGKSHVTVEVAPPVKEGQQVSMHQIGEPGLNPDHPSILQIKGAQNRAPVAKYLPYVQDFVRGGKWGEVGDLENTNLKDTVRNLEGSDPAFRQHAQDKLGKYSTEGEVESLFKEWHKNKETGVADPKLLAGIAAAGGLAAYFSERPEDADALAAAGMLAAVKKSTKGGIATAAKGLDYYLGALSTRLGEISPALKLRARDFERKVLKETEESLNVGMPFLKILKDTPEGSPLDMALLNGDAAGIKAALTPEQRPAYVAVRKLLDKFEETHKELGRFREGLSSYFPRIVTDLEGLKNALGQEQRTTLEENLIKAEAKMILKEQRGLTDIETSLIVNQSLAAKPSGSHLPGFAKQRGVETVTPELRPFYAKPTDSLLRYVSAAIQDAEMARFFGKDLATRKVGSKVMTDVDGSIGNIVAAELKAGRMTHEQANDLRALLKARFEGGEKSMTGALQDVRNASNIALLGQFGSAATQIGDSNMTVYHHSLMPTLRALKAKLTGDQQITAREFGLVNHIAEELGSNRMTGKALQAVFKASGFSAIDQFAKGLNLNAGLIKNQALATTQKGRAKLAQKYAVAFGDEFPQLLADLQSKTISEPVRSLVFSELSDAQPLTKMEMPQAYLENPNGRLLYQMKTYMLKQMDVIRRDAYNEIRDGNYVTGAKNLVAVASALALSNIPGDIIKDWISGRDVSLDKIDYVEALLKNFGLNRYTMDQVSKGKPLEVARDMVSPPFKHFQELLTGQGTKLAKYVPLVGRAIYDRELGGNEARARSEAIRERIKIRDEMESSDPALKIRRLERKARREAKMRGDQ